MQDYWSAFAHRRLTRRRALAMTGTSAAGAALLTACGSSSTTSPAGGSSKPADDKSGLVTKPEDAARSAKPGAVLKTFTTSDPITLDPLNPVNPLNVPAAFIYSTLVREKPGVLEGSKGDLTGDLAESWEL